MLKLDRNPFPVTQYYTLKALGDTLYHSFIPYAHHELPCVLETHLHELPTLYYHLLAYLRPKGKAAIQI